jgi:hypothetical protein
MSDDIAKKTAEDFRLLGGQEPRVRPADPFNKPAAGAATVAPAAEQPASGGTGASAVEAALERALGRVLARTPGGGVASAEIIARLDEMKARAGERDDELNFELRNGLPGRIRREIHEQLRPTEERLASLERGMAEAPKHGSKLSGILPALLYAVLTGFILAGFVIFEKPLRNWGQDTIYPLLGMSIGEAQRVLPTEKKAPPLGDR